MSAPPTPIDPVHIDWAEIKKIGQRSASYFLGPKAENIEFVNRFFNEIITPSVAQARLDFHEEDNIFITEETQNSEEFQNTIGKLEVILKSVSGYMGQHNIPFYSPRYMAHMIMEPSLPATLGYIMSIFYNPNNFSPAASPFTTIVELFLSQDLCEMLGYRRRPHQFIGTPKELEDAPIGWGHITAGGSIANLESTWAARNLKFYALSLKNAMTQGDDPPLAFIYDTFEIKLCTGEVKLFKDCTTWELLNLKSQTILGIPDTLAIEYGISTQFVESTMTKYNVQTIGKDVLEKQFKIKSPQILISYTNHFSWAKAVAILGIGSGNLVEVPVDINARVDINELDKHLARCLGEQRAVYATVAIFGSTEVGAVDPLGKIIELRKKYESMGLSFLVNVDAAWGGYFTTIIRPDPDAPDAVNLPAIALSPHTHTEMENLRHADAITLDPHKSGYCPYPGGGLCYRDERMRFLVTWAAPYVVQGGGGAETMGAYGVEASKPGAAPVGAWVASSVMGLHSRGYGALLAQTIYSSARLWCHWATMGNADFYSTAINLFPSERIPGHTRQDIENEKHFIRSRILNQSNERLFADPAAINKLKQLGSDLMINAWAVNFRINGVANTNAAEASHFNSRINDVFTVNSPADDLDNMELIVMATTFSQERYGQCLRLFKKRIGLDAERDDDLFCLVNVSMSPFPSTTENNFITIMAQAFENKASEIVKELLWRNTPGLARHSFIVQGKNQLHFTYIPNFHTIRSRKQLIISGDVPDDVLTKYHELQDEFPDSVFTLHTAYEEDLDQLVKNGQFTAVIDQGVPKALGMFLKDDTQHSIPPFEVTNVQLIKDRILQSPYLDPDYPERMPFYLYGSLEDNELHVDHIIRKSPNISLSSSNVKVDLKYDQGAKSALAEELKKGAIVVFDRVFERALQPFSQTHLPYFFAADESFDVKVYQDATLPPAKGSNPPFPKNYGLLLAVGRITLGSTVFSDFNYINKDPTDSFVNLKDWGKGHRKFGHFLGAPTDQPYDTFHRELNRLQAWEEDMKKFGIHRIQSENDGSTVTHSSGLPLSVEPAL